MASYGNEKGQHEFVDCCTTGKGIWNGLDCAYLGGVCIKRSVATR